MIKKVSGEDFLLKSAIEQLEASVIITDNQGIIKYVNPFFTKNTGYSLSECIGNSPSLLSSGLQSASFYKEMWITINKGKSWTGELQNKRKNGELFWEKVSISPVIGPSGDVKDFIAIYQDISKEKEAKDELAQQERLLSNVEEINETGGWEYDLKTKKIFWTNELYRIHGFRKEDDINFIEESLKCYEPDDRKVVQAAFNNTIETGKGYDLILRFQDKKGNQKWIRTKTEAIKDERGNVCKVFGSVKDITEKYEKENELKETKIRLEYALLGTDAGYWDWDIKQGVCVVNERWATMLGYSLEELNPLTVKKWQSITHPEDLKVAYAEIEKYWNGKTPVYEVVLRMKHKKGHLVWVFVRGSTFGRDEEGNPVRMVGTHLDVSARFKSRMQLEESEKRYRTLFEESTDPSLILQKGIIKDCNLATINLLGYQSKEELIGKHIVDISPDKINGIPTVKLAEKNKNESVNNGHLRAEWIHVKKDGTLVPVEISTTRINAHENIEEAVSYVVWRDISKRKETELALKELYDERGVLLAEIHHRVKNNLAIISGLMHLQISHSNNRKTKEILMKSVNRISAIGHIHELLYHSDDFVNISITRNIHKQVEYIQKMYETKVGAKIEIKLDLDEVVLNINQAIPFGLLINEILNNAYKHAFKEREEGEINIVLREKNSHVNVEIKDNGVGLGDVSNEFKTLGTTLIHSFISQLDAELSVSIEKGLGYSIRFLKKDEKGSSLSEVIKG